MSKTGLDGAKDVFISHENIVRKENPSHQNRYMLDHPGMFTMDIQPPQSANSYLEVRYKERGHTPTLRS